MRAARAWGVRWSFEGWVPGVALNVSGFTVEHVSHSAQPSFFQLRPLEFVAYGCCRNSRKGKGHKVEMKEFIKRLSAKIQILHQVAIYAATRAVGTCG